MESRWWYKGHWTGRIFVLDLCLTRYEALGKSSLQPDVNLLICTVDQGSLGLEVQRIPLELILIYISAPYSSSLKKIIKKFKVNETLDFLRSPALNYLFDTGSIENLINL